MTSPLRVTVSLADVPEFAARYCLIQRRTGRTVDGLPECEWQPGPGQTSEQAALVANELKDGTKWNASKFS